MNWPAYFIALAYILVFFSAKKYLICGDDLDHKCKTYDREVIRQSIITSILINSLVLLTIYFGSFAPSDTKHGIIVAAVLYFGYSVMQLVFSDEDVFSNREKFAMSAVVFGASAYLIHNKNMLKIYP